MYEDDYLVKKSIPQQNPQSTQPPHTIHTLLFEIQYQYFNDSHLSQDILTNMTNFLSPNADDSAHINALIQPPFEPITTQSLPFLIHPVLIIVKLLKTFSFHPMIF